MAGNQQFCLRWNNHQCTLISVFDNLLESGTLVDCTLAAEGQYLKAHKVVLSACSPFFEGLFSQHPENHPIIILKDVTFSELKAMLDYMYRGEVNISQDQLGTFLKAAESLQIKGLTDQSAAHGNGDLYRKAPPEPRRVIVPPISKSPIIGYPAGQGLPLVVEPRPPSSGPPSGQLPVHPASTPLKLTNNNVESPPRRKRRLSDDEPTAIEGAATQQTAPQVLAGALLPTTLPPVKLEQPPPQQPPSLDDYYKFKQEHKSDASVNNDDSGEEGGGGGPPYAADAEYDDEEEEMDLSSKPGTSTTPNSHPPGGWNESSDNTSTEQFTPGGSQEQDQSWRFVTRPLVPSLKGAPTMTVAPSSGANTGSTGATSAGRGGPPSRNISCPTCHKFYSSQHTLRRHIRLECGKEPQFHCPYCPRKTKQRYNLMLHIARAHKPEQVTLW